MWIDIESNGPRAYSLEEPKQVGTTATPATLVTTRQHDPQARR